jgi:hypothetical protein
MCSTPTRLLIEQSNALSKGSDVNLFLLLLLLLLFIRSPAPG